MFWSLPNTLSLVRIVLIPFLVYFLTDGGPFFSWLATAIFFVACLTDFFDGYLARLHAATTTLGKLLDPLADKLIVVAALIMLVAMDRSPRLPAWIVVVIVVREIAITGLRGIALSEGLVLQAEEMGKYKMLFQIFAIHGLLIHYSYFSIDFHLVGMYFLWISMVIGIWSGVAYYVKVIRQVKNRRHPPSAPVYDRAQASG